MLLILVHSVSSEAELANIGGQVGFGDVRRWDRHVNLIIHPERLLLPLLNNCLHVDVRPKGFFPYALLNAILF